MTRISPCIYGVSCGLQPFSGIHWRHPTEPNSVKHLEIHSAAWLEVFQMTERQGHITVIIMCV
jgi:hypothetical protein